MYTLEYKEFFVLMRALTEKEGKLDNSFLKDSENRCVGKNLCRLEVLV